jgi:drug/metabolite transporter (DMT)-like permease
MRNKRRMRADRAERVAREERVAVGHRPIPPTIVAVALLLAALWGGTATAIKVSLRDLPALGLAGLRFSIGALLVYLWARAQRAPIRLQPGEAAPIFLLTLVFAAQIATFNWGTGLTQAGRSTLILNSYPLWVLLLAHLFVPGDQLSPAKVAGAACAFVGLAIVFSESFSAASGSLAGDLMVLTSALLLAAQVVMVNRMVRAIDPNRLLLWQMLFSLPIYFLGSALLGEGSYRFSLPGVLALLYQGVMVAGVCFIVWTALLKTYSPSRLSVILFTTPLFGILLSRLVLGEPVSPHLGADEILVARQPRVVAVRFHAHRGKESYLDSFADRGVRAFWEKALELGLIIELHIGPNYAASAAEALRVYPESTVIIDHLAEPHMGDAVEYAHVLEIATFDRVFMKLSGLAHFAQDAPLYLSARPFTRRVVETFGPDRMVWGGGTPEIVDAHMEGYPESDRMKVKGDKLACLVGFG